MPPLRRQEGEKMGPSRAGWSAGLNHDPVLSRPVISYANNSVLNGLGAATGSHWSANRRVVKWENLGKVKTSCAAAF